MKSNRKSKAEPRAKLWNDGLQCVYAVTAVWLFGCVGCAAEDNPPCVLPNLLVTTSDFSVGEMAVLDGTSLQVLAGPADLVDQDTVPQRHGCSVALLERGHGDIRLQEESAPLQTAGELDLDPAVTNPYATNPQRVVPVAENKTYVVPMALNEVLVMDPRGASGPELVGSIDLSPFVTAQDTDGNVEPISAVAVGGRLYVALGRYYFDSAFKIHFTGSVLAVVDTATDSLVDMDDQAQGIQGISLIGNNPSAGLRYDSMTDSIWVGSGGDFFLQDGLLERVDASTGQSMTVVTEGELGGQLGGFAIGMTDEVWIHASDQLLVWDRTTEQLDVSAYASGVDGLLQHDSRLYVWKRQDPGAGLRAFDLQSDQEITPASGPVQVGAYPIYGLAPAP